MANDDFSGECKMKKIIIISVILGVVLFCANLIIPIIWAKEDVTQIIVAVISGWVSGVATLLVGIIAALQTKKYNEANELFLRRQFELEKNKTLIQSRLLFVDNLKKAWNAYQDSANPAKILSKTLVIRSSSLSPSEIKQTIFQTVLEYQLQNRACHSSFKTAISCDYKESVEKNKTLETLNDYRKIFNSFMSDGTKNKDPNKLQTDCLNLLKDKYLELVKVVDDYVLMCDSDINESIANKSDDFVFLSSSYSPKKNSDDSDSD